MARNGHRGPSTPVRTGPGPSGEPVRTGPGPSGEVAPHDRLSSLRVGGDATIAGLDENLSRQIARRLHALGFRPGTAVTCVRRAPLGSPTVYRVGEADICLRRAEASVVTVLVDRP